MFLFNKKQYNNNMGSVFFSRLFWIIILFSFIAWFVGILIDPQGSQIDVFHIRMKDFWGDATVVTHFVKDKNPYINPGANYPPLPYMMYYILALVSVVPDGGYQQYYYQPLWSITFFLFLFVTVGMLWQICVKQLQETTHVDAVMVGLTFCLSAPMLYTLERGNAILPSVLFASIFVFYYDSNSKWKKEVALISLAIATSIKLVPGVFGLLLLCNRDWKGVLRVSLYTVLFLFLPFFFFEGGLNNVQRLYHNLYGFLDHYAVDGAVSGTGLVAGVFKLGKSFFGESYGMNVSTYNFLRYISVQVSAVLFLSIFHLEEKWKQAFNLNIILLIFPSVAFQYYFLYSIPVIVLFLNASASRFIENKLTNSMDKMVVLASFIMIYFVYRCSLSNFFDQHFAVLLLTIVGVYYSIQAFRKSGHILPRWLFHGQ